MPAFSGMTMVTSPPPNPPPSRGGGRAGYFFLFFLRLAEEGLFDDARLGRRTALTFPVFSPPQKKRSAPSDSSPETCTPGGMAIRSSTAPVLGSRRRNSLSSPSHVPCQSSPSTQVTPVTKRLLSMVRR